MKDRVELIQNGAAELTGLLDKVKADEHQKDLVDEWLNEVHNLIAKSKTVETFIIDYIRKLLKPS